MFFFPNSVTNQSLTLDRGAAVLLLDAGFPVPAASGFPLSPLTLLAPGRTDFFMLSSVMLVHRQLALNIREGRRKVKDVTMHNDRSNFPKTKNSFHQQKRKKEKLSHHHTEQQETLVCFCHQSLFDKVCFGSRAPKAAATIAQRFKGDSCNPGYRRRPPRRRT